MRDEEALIRSKAGQWRRLTELSDQIDRYGFKKLTGEEMTEFVRLYRATSADLAQFSTASSSEEVIRFLESTVARAYGQLYRRPVRPFGETVRLCLWAAADTVRRRWTFIAASIGVFIVAGVAGWILSQNPTLPFVGSSPGDTRQFVVPPMIESTFAGWREGELQENTAEGSVQMTSLYATNNPRVTLLAFAIGAGTFGFGTIGILWTNGALIGALSADMASVGLLGFLYVSIFPHGVTELGGIFIGCSGGLLMGWATVRPGRRSRGEALREAGLDAIVLCMIGVAMTFFIAPVEGFFSFNPNVPDWAKLAFIVLSLGAWLAFFVGYGRSIDPKEAFGIRRAEDTSRRTAARS